mgnify:FL=1
MDRWREYFKELLNIENDEMSCRLQEHEVVDLNERAEEEKIETEEVMEAIRVIKNRKSARHHKITPTMIKSM